MKAAFRNIWADCVGWYEARNKHTGALSTLGAERINGKVQNVQCVQNIQHAPSAVFSVLATKRNRHSANPRN